jgi:hypothetical protein
MGARVAGEKRFTKTDVLPLFTTVSGGRLRFNNFQYFAECRHKYRNVGIYRLSAFTKRLKQFSNEYITDITIKKAF